MAFAREAKARGLRIKSTPSEESSRTRWKTFFPWNAPLEQGVFDAIRLQYLKVLSFGFYTDRDEKSIIESYEFKGLSSMWMHTYYYLLNPDDVSIKSCPTRIVTRKSAVAIFALH